MAVPDDDPAVPIATPRVAAAAVIRDPSGRVLLVKPTYKPMWDLPGGYAEPGESPLAACRREVLEELGVRMSLGRLLVIDWAPLPEEGDKLLFLFEGGVLPDTSKLQLQPSEIAEAEMVDADQLDQYLPSRLTRRTLAALTRA